MYVLPPAHTESVKRLTQLQGLVALELEQYGFQILSPFAERFGAWELRFFREHGRSTDLISLSCDSAAGESIPSQIWAGSSLSVEAERVSGTFKRVLVASPVIEAVAALDSTLKAILNDAVDKAGSIREALTPRRKRLRRAPRAEANKDQAQSHSPMLA